MDIEEETLDVGFKGSAEEVDQSGAPNGTISEDWKDSLNRVVPCVVVLKITQTRSFDTESACSSYATGFVVDSRRGLILTNRHVCTPGPIIADAIFLNREELPVRPVYRDPVHDFGFLKFEPDKLQFMALGEIPLVPEEAAVGLDIRVVGNDSGEKVSILSGVLARLDRDAPFYGKKAYNDFNTFYLQAASGTKGGSSGSPVVDCRGRAVGLNAGGRNKAQSAYYLPLERVVRVLRILQASKEVGSSWDAWKAPEVPRGDLQTTFIFKGFDEVRRLGLRAEIEKEVRAAPPCCHGTAPDAVTTGLLVVDNVLPGSPAHGIIEPGDVLVRLQGKVVTHFLQLEEVLDEYVGKSVELQLERAGKQVDVVLSVEDLHRVTPDCFLEIAGGSVHALSYQQARNSSMPVGQVYVSEPGYMLGRAQVPKHAIITCVAGKPTTTLEAFTAALRDLPHGARTPLEYLVFSDRHRRKNTLLFVDRQWYGPPVMWTRDDTLGLWHPQVDQDQTPPSNAVVIANPAVSVTSSEAKSMDRLGGGQVEESAAAASSAGVLEVKKACGPEVEQAEKETTDQDLREAILNSCMVLAEVEIPLVCLVDGVHGRSFTGTGVVLYHGERIGLVLLDRNTMVVGPSDINLTFAAYPAEVSAKGRFLHPLHNFSLVSYDPTELPPAAREQIKAVVVDTRPIKRGEEVILVGVSKCLRIMQKKAVITHNTLALNIPTAEVPRFRAVHEEVVKLDQDFGSAFSGILTDQQGRMRALWGSYAEQEDKVEREWCVGLPISIIQPWAMRLVELDKHLDMLPPPEVRVLEAELEPLMLSKAAQHKLPSEWLTRLATLDPERKQVLRVRSTVAKSHAARVLKCGDMILAISGRPVSCFADVEQLCGQIPSISKAEIHVETSMSESADPEDIERHPKRLRMEESNKHSALASPQLTSDPEEDLLDVTICRGGVVQDVQLRLGAEDGMGTNRIIHWCGAQLQAPHRAAREHGYLPECSGVFISRWHHGSPSHRYGLYALHFIAELNGTATPDLATFLEVARDLKDGDFVRVKLIQMETCQPKIITLKMDLTYWPTWELSLDPKTCKWQRKTISSSTTTACLSTTG